MRPHLALAALLIATPANAGTISFGELMYTDLFRWQGQYGTPTWHEILAEYDCTPELDYYLWHEPEPPVVDDVAAPPYVVTPVSPPGAAIPEPSTWLMLILGVALLLGVGRKRANQDRE